MSSSESYYQDENIFLSADEGRKSKSTFQLWRGRNWRNIRFFFFWPLQPYQLEPERVVINRFGEWREWRRRTIRMRASMYLSYKCSMFYRVCLDFSKNAATDFRMNAIIKLRHSTKVPLFYWAIFDLYMV